MRNYATLRQSIGLVLAVLCTALTIGGCASTQIPAPEADMAKARMAIESAQQADAQEHAPLELRRAQKKLEEAQHAVARSRHEQAKRLAEAAAVDAELAQVKAMSAKAQRAVAELRESIQALEAEIARNQ